MNIFGKPTGLTQSNLSEFLALANQNNGRKPVQYIPPDDTSSIENLAPPEFIDSITFTLMKMPYKLPSGKHVDKETLDRYLNDCVSNSVDPFTRIPFSNQYWPIFDEELKRRIDLFVIKNGKSENEKNESPKEIG